MKRAICGIVAGVMAFANLTTAVPATANDTVGVSTVFSEDFENYDIATWSADDNVERVGTTAMYNIIADGTTSGDWTINSTSMPANLGIISIVDAEEETDIIKDQNSHGQVLKYEITDSTGAFLLLRRNANVNTRGKILQYEFDVYFPQGYKQAQTSLPAKTNVKTDTTMSNYNNTDIMTHLTSKKLQGGGGQSSYSANRALDVKYECFSAITQNGTTNENAPLSADNWHHITVVADMSATATTTRPDTWRMYVDGVLQEFHYYAGGMDSTIVYDVMKRDYASKSSGITGYSMSDTFYGLFLGGKGQAATEGALYIDNMNAKVIDTKFAVSGVSDINSSFDPDTDSIVYNFTTPVSENSLNHIKIIDKDGTAVDGAVSIRTLLSNGGKTLTLYIQGGLLRGSEQYKVVFPAQFCDIYGQGLVTYYSARRHSSGMPVESATVAQSHEYEASIFTTVSVINPEVTPSQITDYCMGEEQEIKLVFPDEFILAEGIEAKDAFTVKNDDGNVAEGLIATVSEDKKTITLNLKELNLLTGKYYIEIVKNAIKDNSGSYATAVVPIEQRAFDVSYESVISNYTPLTQKRIEIVFTSALSNTSAGGIANAFSVKNKYNNSIAGIDVSVSQDKKIVYIELGGLDIEGGTYNISSKENMIYARNGANTEQINIVLNTDDVAEEAPEDYGITDNCGTPLESPYETETLLTDDFESYTPEVEWLESVPDSRWIITKTNSSEFADSTIRVTDDPLNNGNKVLKISSGNMDSEGNLVSDGTKYNTVSRNTDTTSVIDDEKVISLKAKVYFDAKTISGIPTGTSYSDEGEGKNNGYILAPSVDETGKISADLKGNLRRSSLSPAFCSYTVPIGHNKSTNVDKVFESDKWTDVEMVMKNYVLEDGTTTEGYEFYIDGEKVSLTLSGTVYDSLPGSYTPFYGMAMRVVTNKLKGASPVVYYDDLSATVYNVLKTHIDVPKSDVTADKQIVLTFTNEMTEEALNYVAENLVVKDLYDNTASVKVQTEGNNRVIIIPEYNWKYNTSYVISVSASETATDVFGQKYPGFSYSFSTSEAESVTIVENASLVYNADYLIDADEIVYNMEISEVSVSNIKAAVAVYGDNKELLGVGFETIAAGETERQITVNLQNSGAKLIRMFIWNENEDGSFGKMLQEPGKISSR